MIVTHRCIISFLLLFFFQCGVSKTAHAEIIVHSAAAVSIELIGYNGLASRTLFKGELAGRDNRVIETSYRGLALLQFAEGQRYPVIIGDDSFTLQVNNPAQPPSFAGSSENDVFYRLLAGSDSESGRHPFPLLMIQAKQLLESTNSIRTTKELTAKKKEVHQFVGNHYASLKHSDMVRRLIAQYFMMHEYIDYHLKGAPASDIRVRYQQEIVLGIESWLTTLQPHIPGH